MKSVNNIYICILPLIFLSACTATLKKTEPTKTQAVALDSISVKFQLVSNGAAVPVEINAPGDNSGRMFVTDVSGKIWILKNDSILPKPFYDRYGKSYKVSETSPIGKVYSVAFNPQYSTNGKFYVCYVAPATNHKDLAKLVVSQFTVDKKNPDLADIKSEQTVIQFEGPNIKGNGAEIRFGPDGDLYISVGDDKAGNSTYIYRGQNLAYLNGKLLRIDVNKIPYAIPADNPFVGVKNARPEIWAYGFRKLWRFSFDPATHDVFGGDVGENRVEEIDEVVKGGNYGWPVIEGDSSFEKNDFTPASPFIAPLSTYTHKVGICVIGGDFYHGDDIPLLRDKYIYADWTGILFALTKTNDGNWTSQALKIANKPSDSFFICGCYIDANNQLFVMGYLANKDGNKGVIYKVIKA
jgi:glucose/arabinose dehydrogenase